MSGDTDESMGTKKVNFAPDLTDPIAALLAGSFDAFNQDEYLFSLFAQSSTFVCTGLANVKRIGREQNT